MPVGSPTRQKCLTYLFAAAPKDASLVPLTVLRKCKKVREQKMHVARLLTLENTIDMAGS
jgi:hypothetical protein